MLLHVFLKTRIKLLWTLLQPQTLALSCGPKLKGRGLKSLETMLIVSFLDTSPVKASLLLVNLWCYPFEVEFDLDFVDGFVD